MGCHLDVKHGVWVDCVPSLLLQVLGELQLPGLLGCYPLRLKLLVVSVLHSPTQYSRGQSDRK